MSDKTWQEMSDDELLGLHAKGTLPKEAERAIGAEHLRMVVAWDGAHGVRPPLFPEAEEEGPQYNSLTNDMLVHLLAGRGLDVSGKKAAMVARLQADDLATAEGKPALPPVLADEEDVNDDDDSITDTDDEDEDDEDEKPSPKPEPKKAKAKKKKD